MAELATSLAATSHLICGLSAFVGASAAMHRVEFLPAPLRIAADPFQEIFFLRADQMQRFRAF